MVRAVIGDETHVEAFIDNQLQSGITLQVGLAIGRLGTGSSRDAVFSLIPTPQNDGQDVVLLEGESRVSKEAEKRKGAKGKAASQNLQIDMDWVAEHARQVSKMLVGGIRVVGFYILASESTFKNSTALLWQMSKVVAAAAGHASDNKLPLEESLLLHFSYSPRRVFCRSCSFELGFGTSSLRPCEWKLARAVSTLHSFGCSYSFESRVPIFANKPSKKRLFDTLLSAISMEASRLESAVVLMDGSLVAEDKALAGDINHEVEIFLPFDSAADVSSGEVTGLATLRGSVRAQAYGFSRDPLSRAVADLKADIVKSLRSRLEILYDEVDPALKDADSAIDATGMPLHPLQRIEDAAEYRCKLPRRVFIPWLEGILLCDYMQEGETFQDLNSRCKELLGMDEPLDQSKILEHEDDDLSLRERSFWDISINKSIPDSNVQQSKTQLNKQISNVANVKTTSNKTAMLSFVVLLVACIVAYFLTIDSRHIAH